MSMYVRDPILRARVEVAVGQRALLGLDLRRAIDFAQSATRIVSGAVLDRRVALNQAAAEVLIGAALLESWSWHHHDALEEAAAASNRAHGWALVFCPNERIHAEAQLRQIEVLEAQESLRAALKSGFALYSFAKPWPDIQLAASYVAITCAAKLRDDDALALARWLAARALRLLGDHPWKGNYRRAWAIAAIHTGRFKDANEALIEARDLTKSRAARLENLLVLSHLHLASGDTSTGEEIAREALRLLVQHRTWRSASGFLRYAGPLLPADLYEDFEAAHDEGVLMPPRSRRDVAPPE